MSARPSAARRRYVFPLAPALTAVLVLAAVLAAPACSLAGDADTRPSGAANVILMIGDGMGPEQVKLGRLAKGKPLVFEGFPHRSTCTTHPAEGGVTDSAAAGTALATGHKTDRGSVSVDPRGRRLETILEMFRKRGARTGLVTTTEVVDATPAAFAAHVPSRYLALDIAEEMLGRTRPNVVMGGGAHWVDRALKRLADADGGAEKLPYRVVRTRKELAKVDAGATSHLLGLFSESAMPYETDRTPHASEPTLQEMTRAALDVLAAGQGAGKGFFLMVEGGRIDHACHGNDAMNAAVETVEFDKAVQAVVNWVDARKAWGRTLVIVTADHECGGLTVKSDHTDADGYPDDVEWSTGSHTATAVPIYARGLCAERVKAVKDNTDVFDLMKHCLEAPAKGAPLKPVPAKPAVVEPAKAGSAAPTPQARPLKPAA